MIRVRTLGQCAIQIDSIAVGPDAEIVFAALLLLTVEPGRRLGRGELLGMLWPGTTEARAAHCLRQTIYRLRTLGVPLEVSRASVSVAAEAVDSDVDVLLRTRRPDGTECLADGIDGSFLPGYSPGFSEPLRDWVERQRDLVTAAARRVFVGAIAARKARADWGDVERLAHRCLAIDPLNEDATLALAEAAALHGGKVEAIGILDRYLREMGPTARELRLPAMALRRRISEPEMEFPLAPPLHVPFVGRTAEMGSLGAALRAARGGGGSVYLIHGEPGIGKTRLLNEFSRVASLEGARIAAALCQSSDARRPLSAFVDLVPKLMTMPGALGCSPQSHKYLRRLVDHHDDEPALSSNSAEAALLYAKVRRSMFDLLDAISSEALLIVTIDDTQWLDAASWEIVAEATRWMETRRMMLILTSRDVEHSFPATGWPRSLQSVGLGPIDYDACKRLFDATVGHAGRVAAKAFRDWCVEMSGGNPYYLSELALRGIDVQGGFEPPPSLTSLVTQRIERLQPLSRRILQACAVLGKNATLRRVQIVLDQPCTNLLDNLDELAAARLVHVDGPRIVPQHHLLAQAATSRASVLSQQLLHQRAATVLEKDYSLYKIPSLAWDSAEHWRLSGEPDKGIELALACARYSLQFGRPTEAVAIIKCVLPWSHQTDVRVRVWSEYARALRAAEQWRDLADTLERLLPDLESSKMADLASACRLDLLEARWNAGRISQTVVDDLIQECKVGPANAVHKLRAATAAIIISDNICCPGTAARVEDFARTLAARTNDGFAGRDYDLVFQCSYGDLDRAMEVAAGLLASIRETESQPLLCRYLLRAAHVFEVGDRIDQSLRCAREAFSIAERFALFGSACLAARRLAWIYLDQLSIDDVAVWTDKGDAWAKRSQHPASIADLTMLQAEVALGTGRISEADAFFQQSQALWKPIRHPRADAHALALKIALAVERGEQMGLDDVSDAWRLLRTLANRSTLDLAIGRFVLGLAASSRKDDAVTMLDEYVSTSRRERGPLRPVFRHLVGRACTEFGLNRDHSSNVTCPERREQRSGPLS